MLTKVFTSHGVIGLREPIGDPPTLTHSLLEILPKNAF